MSDRIDNRFDQTDDWLNQMEAKIERTEAASIELHNEGATQLEADVRELDEKLDDVTSRHMRAVEEMLREQLGSMTSQVDGNSEETEHAKQLVKALRQDHAAHEAAISERVEHNSASLRDHESHFSRMEHMEVTMRKFSERLTQMDDNDTRRMRNMERDLRDNVERVEQLQVPRCLTAALPARGQSLPCSCTLTQRLDARCR